MAATTPEGDFSLFPGETGLQGLTGATIAATNAAPAATAAATAPDTANAALSQALASLFLPALQQGF